ncbi:hypothetical protein GOX01_08220 [Gluconobacter oxydans]|nr:hypothetical protein GOX01_08220 [Gluconobacter oxydans]
MFFSIKQVGGNRDVETGIFGLDSCGVDIFPKIRALELEEFLTVCQSMQEDRLRRILSVCGPAPYAVNGKFINLAYYHQFSPSELSML